MLSVLPNPPFLAVRQITAILTNYDWCTDVSNFLTNWAVALRWLTKVTIYSISHSIITIYEDTVIELPIFFILALCELCKCYGTQPHPQILTRGLMVNRGDQTLP